MSRHINCVATGWCDGRAPVCTEDKLCRNREFSVATDFLKFSVATGPGEGADEAHGDRAPWKLDRVRDRAHDACDCAQSARDNTHNIRADVGATDSIRCTVLYTVEYLSWELFTNTIHEHR